MVIEMRTNFISDVQVPNLLGLCGNSVARVSKCDSALSLAESTPQSKSANNDFVKKGSSEGSKSANNDSLKGSSTSANNDSLKGSSTSANNDSLNDSSPLPVPIGPQMEWLDQYIVHLLVDPRDTVFVKTSLWLSVTVVSALWLTCVKFSWWHFAIHAAWVLRSAPTFVLMLHCVCHRSLYKSQHSLLNGIIPYIIAPAFGHTWNTFYYHHIKHHHVEDNGPSDLSCTLRYQRDSFLGFLHYFTKFLFLGIYELSWYFAKKGWYMTAIKVIAGEFGSLALFITLSWLGQNVWMNQGYLGGSLAFGLPLFLMRFGMMSGNWAQHSFVDPKRLDCDYVQSLTCIDVHYNNIAFNDGYHTSHHLNPRRHWADHPRNLIEHQSEYAKQGTLVLRGVDFHICWFFLMTKQYSQLAKAYVHMDPNTPRPCDDDIIAMLKERVKRLPDDYIDAYYATQAKRRM